jgi:hypothetical protein
VRTRRLLISDIIRNALNLRSAVGGLAEIPVEELMNIPSIARALERLSVWPVDIPRTFARLLSIPVWIFIILQVILVVVAIVLLFAWPWILVGSWQRIGLLVASPWLRGVAVATFFVAGFLLYLARLYMRPLYGLAEIILGVVACWVSLSDLTKGALATTIVLTGAIYVMVRGLDNLIDDESITASKNSNDDSVGVSKEVRG